MGDGAAPRSAINVASLKIGQDKAPLEFCYPSMGMYDAGDLRERQQINRREWAEQEEISF